jgi:hypothetical protein
LPDLQAVDGNIKTQMAAALNKCVETNNPTNWRGDPGNYYQQPIMNHYSAIFHADTQTSNCYGFAYDDVRSHSLTLTGDQPTVLKIYFHRV